jgi:hypothetical protein
MDETDIRIKTAVINKTKTFPLNFLAKSNDMNIESNMTVQFPISNKRFITLNSRTVICLFSFEVALVI